jgi:hypothetical protein
LFCPAGASTPPLPAAAATATAGVAALSPLSLLTPARVLHTIVEFSNLPVKIVFIKGGCAVPIIVAPDIKDISVPQEDGITRQPR